ncbi:MAG: cytochrome P460 family protein, partial [Dokdonella sp.]
MRSIAASIGILLLGTAASAGEAPSVPFPDGFRDWHHVKTTVILPGHPMHAFVGGIDHTYANAPAMQGYASGIFPDGSILVYDTIDAHEADHAIDEGKRKVLGVMVKDSKRY